MERRIQNCDPPPVSSPPSLTYLCRIQPTDVEGREGGGSVGSELLSAGSKPQHPGVLFSLGHAQNHLWL